MQLHTAASMSHINTVKTMPDAFKNITGMLFVDKWVAALSDIN